VFDLFLSIINLFDSNLDFLSQLLDSLRQFLNHGLVVFDKPLQLCLFLCILLVLILAPIPLLDVVLFLLLQLLHHLVDFFG
jgi:hypothetical protein